MTDSSRSGCLTRRKLSYTGTQRYSAVIAVTTSTIAVTLLCALGAIKAFGDDGAPPARYTDRSFVFLWPHQPQSEAKLDLSEPIVTDRPDFTEASSPVGEGVVQAELGYTFYYTDGADARHDISHVYPELLLRAGLLSDWFELRVGQTMVTLDQAGESSTGFADMYLGVKLGIVPQRGILPEVSIVPQLSVPSGSSELRADGPLYGVNLLYSWSLLSDSYLGASTQFNQREGDEGGEVYTSFAQALVAGTSWDGVWGSYIEWFALFADSVVGGEDAHYANGGVTYLINNDLQLDLRVGSRLQDRFGEEIFAGIGVSVRYL